MCVNAVQRKRLVTRLPNGKGPTGTRQIQTAVTISPHVAQTSKPLTDTSSRKLWIPLDAEAHSLLGGCCSYQNTCVIIMDNAGQLFKLYDGDGASVALS